MTLRIAVCVKLVPRSVIPMRLDETTLRMDRSGPTEINPTDLPAIEAALQLRERAGEGEVVVVSVGPEPGAESLRVALAMGADRAICVSDALIEGSDLVGTSRVLAAVLGREAPDIVLTGSQSRDGGGGTMAGAVAESLGMPVVSGVYSIEILGDAVRAARQVVGGEQVVDVPRPCVVSIAGLATVPRYPSFRDIVTAKKRPIEIRSLAETGCAQDEVGGGAARTRVFGIDPPPARGAGGEIREDTGQAAAWLTAFLIERGLV